MSEKKKQKLIDYAKKMNVILDDATLDFETYKKNYENYKDWIMEMDDKTFNWFDNFTPRNDDEFYCLNERTLMIKKERTNK